MAKMRIGILTGGGDVSGLNAVIKSVTYRGSENDIEVFGLRCGRPWRDGTISAGRHAVGSHRGGRAQQSGKRRSD